MTGRLGWAPVCCLLVIAACFAFFAQKRLDALAGTSRPAADFSLENSTRRIFGSAEEMIGDSLFLKADAYFHGGVEAKYREHDEEDAAKEGHQEQNAASEEPQDWIAKINRQVQSHEHTHLTHDDQKEMLPFFALSTRLDPHNVEAILTTAYWLERSFLKPDEALQTLLKGSEDNPGSWEIDFTLAGLYFRYKKDYLSSARYYSEAVQKSGPAAAPKHFLVDMHYYLAESLRMQGKSAEALAEYRKAGSFYAPADISELKNAIQKKIAELGGAAPKPV